jgi:hypothetical protein
MNAARHQETALTATEQYNTDILFVKGFWWKIGHRLGKIKVANISPFFGIFSGFFSKNMLE